MGLSQSCLKAPKTEDFEAPIRHEAPRQKERASIDVKPRSAHPASIKEGAAVCLGGSCGTGNITEQEACLAPSAVGVGAAVDKILAETIETAQLSGALTATATTASLQSTFMSSDGYPHSGWDLGPPSTDDEQSRLQAVRALDVLDSVSQGRRFRLDEEANMVLGALMQMFNAMTAMLVLFDDTRIIIRNAVGIMKPGEFPYRWSFCAYTLTKHRPQTLVVPDATQDSRFIDNPFVRGAPHLRFYCGSPLVSTSGHILGTLCFADNKPRPGFDVTQCYLMNNLAELMVRHLERYRANAGPAGAIDAETTALTRVARTIECYEMITGLVDISLANGWMLMYVNEAWEALCTPWTRKQLVGRPLQQLLILEAEDQEAEPPAMETVAETAALFTAASHGAMHSGGGSGSKKRLASAAASPFILTKAPSGTTRGSQAADASETVGRSGSSTSSGVSASGAFASDRYASVTSISGGGEGGAGIVIDGDRAVDVRLMAMQGPERRQWRQQREGRLEAWAGGGWERYAVALRAGEEVDLGRARLLLGDGQPSTTVVRVTVRSANCHVLDAAVRMPVGVPHQLGLPTSILAAAAADGDSTMPPTDPAATLPDTKTPGEAAAATPAAAAVPDGGKPEPQYCIVTLFKIDDGTDGDDMQEEEEEEGQGEASGQQRGAPPAAGGPGAAVAGGAVGCEPAAAELSAPVSRFSARPGRMSYSKGRPSVDNSSVYGSGGGADIAVRDLSSPVQQRPSYRAQSAVQHCGRPSLDNSGMYGSCGGRSRGLSAIASAVGARGSNMRSSASQGGCSWAYGMEPFPGLRLQHLLGKGGYGRVFAASYKGQKVAAKVICNTMVKTATCVNGVTLEALLTQEIEHPYIVRTYKCVVRSYLPGEWPSATGTSLRSSSVAGMSNLTNAPHRSSAAQLPLAMASGLSALSRGPSDGHDVPVAASRLSRPSEAGRALVAAAPEAMYDSRTMGCKGRSVTAACGSALAACDVPRAVVVAAPVVVPDAPAFSQMATTVVPAAPPAPATVVAAPLLAAAGAVATAPAAAAAMAPLAAVMVAPLPASVGAAATAPPPQPAAQEGDFDSFNADGEEDGGGGGMIDQLTSAGPPVYVPQSAAHSHAGAPSAASHVHLQPHLAGAVAAYRLSVTASGATAQSTTHGSILSAASASAEQAAAAMAMHGRPHRMRPGVDSPADLVGSCGGGGGTGGSVFTAAAAAVAAGADTSSRQSARAQTDALPEGETWILQEFCAGGTLQDAIDIGRLRTEPSRLRGSPHMPYILLTAQEIAAAMTCVHSRGYLHGDLSAVNVLLTDAPTGGKAEGTSGRGWIAKVSDFGLAKHLPDPTQPCISSGYGVITHCAPEVLRSHAQTQKADVYSFGVLLWQMFTGSRPWANMNRFQIFGAVTSGTSLGLRFLPDQQPPPRYLDLAMRCMSADPAVRPTFAEVCEELRLMVYEAASAGQLQ